MKKVKTYVKGAALALVSGFSFGSSAAAQDAGSFMNSAAGQFNQVRSGMFTIVKAGLVIAGLITLVMAIINVVKGEREAAGKLAWWVIGIAVGFGFVTILQNIGG